MKEPRIHFGLFLFEDTAHIKVKILKNDEGGATSRNVIRNGFRTVMKNGDFSSKISDRRVVGNVFCYRFGRYLYSTSLLGLNLKQKRGETFVPPLS